MEKLKAIFGRAGRIMIAAFLVLAGVVFLPSRLLPAAHAAATLDGVERQLKGLEQVLRDLVQVVGRLPLALWDDVKVTRDGKERSMKQEVSDAHTRILETKSALAGGLTKIDAAKSAIDGVFWQKSGVTNDSVWNNFWVIRNNSEIIKRDSVSARDNAAAARDEAAAAKSNSATARDNSATARDNAAAARDEAAAAKTGIDQVFWQKHPNTGDSVWNNLGVTRYDAGQARAAAEQSVAAVEASRSAMTQAQGEMKSALDRIQAQAAGGVSSGQGGQMIAALEAMAAPWAAAQNCPPDQKREPGWWTVLVPSDPSDFGAPKMRTDRENCGLTEGSLREAEAIRELFERMRENREKVAKAQQEERERLQREAIAEGIDRLRKVAEGIGEAVKDQTGKIVDRLKDLVPKPDPKPDPTPEPGPGDSQAEKGNDFGTGPGNLPGLSKWTNSGCQLPEVSGRLCDAPSLDLGFMVWRPFGDCSQPTPAWLVALRDVVGASILMGVAIMCIRWILAGLGVTAPASVKE